MRTCLAGAVALLCCLPSQLASAAEKKLPDLIKELHSPVKAHRLRAMRELGKHGTAARDAVPGLAENLRHKDKDLANQAARSLAQIGRPAVAELQKALADPAPDVQKRALAALAILGPEAAAAVQRVADFLDNPDAKLRTLACVALSEMGSTARRAETKLASALRDADVGVRFLAAAALHAIGPETLSRVLALLKDSDLGIRQSAVHSLVLFSDSKKGLEALVEALHDPERTIRLVAAGALLQLGSESRDALPALVDNLKEPSRELQIEALNAILAIAEPDDKGLLDSLARINESAHWAEEVPRKHKHSLTPLVHGLKDTRATHRLGALLGLAALGPKAKEALAGVAKCTHDKARCVHAAALLALAALDPRRPARIEEARALLESVQESLKEIPDAEELVQLYMLTSTVSCPGFTAAEHDKAIADLMRLLSRWSRRMLYELGYSPEGVAALARGINATARFGLGFTEPYGALNFKLRRLVKDSKDLAALGTAFTELGQGISGKDTAHALSIQQTRMQVVTDSALLDGLIVDKQQRIQMIVAGEQQTAQMILAAKQLGGISIPVLTHFSPQNPEISIETPYYLVRGLSALPLAYTWPIANSFQYVRPTLGAFLVLHYALPVYQRFGFEDYSKNLQIVGKNVERRLQQQLEKELKELQVLFLIKFAKMMVKTQDLMRKLLHEKEAQLREGLRDPDPLVRWATVTVIARKRVHAERELIGLLRDDVPEVRQAARQALVRLGHGTDFGPNPLASEIEVQKAIERWNTWLYRQDIAPPDAPHRLESPLPVPSKRRRKEGGRKAEGGRLKAEKK
jgi:HEAT repeat protein